MLLLWYLVNTFFCDKEKRSSSWIKSGRIIILFSIFRKELSFSKTLHLYNPWNESKSVKIGRDGQVCFR